MSAIVKIIQQEARKQGLTPTKLSKAAGIPYSRAHELLKAEERRGMENVEKALQVLCPNLWAEIQKAVDK